MRLVRAVVVLWPACVLGQVYTISTFAGGGLPVNLPGTSASIGTVSSVAADTAGNVYIASRNGNVVLRLEAVTGMLTLVAGNGTAGFGGDNGPAGSAQLNQPSAIAVDSAGNVYIADTLNSRIRKVSNGVITTVAGGGILGDNVLATTAQLRYPSGVAVDSAGNLYLTDQTNRVRKVSNGVITTVAGGGVTLGDNGPATVAQLFVPTGLAVDSAGNLYIADTGDNRIREVSNGVITTVAGTGSAGFSGDNGPAISAQLFGPQGVAVDSAGNLYIADTGGNRIRKVSNGVITNAAGTGPSGFGGDNGPAGNAQLNSPVGLAIDTGGDLYIADSGNHRVRKVSDGVITTVAGTGMPVLGVENGPVSKAQLNSPYGLALDSAGTLYVSEHVVGRILRISNGIISTVATETSLSDPLGIATDSAGDVYVAEYFGWILEISNGSITRVAGGGGLYPGDDGPATSAELNEPSDVALDASGDLFIADHLGHRVRKVSNGMITTVAGNGTAGFSGDGGPATSAELYLPAGLALDAAGNLYIVDQGNNRIRKVSNGVITTVAGSGSAGFSGDDGPALSASLSGPIGITVDAVGNLYIADSGHQAIRRVSNGVITTLAGNGTPGFSGDGGPGADGQFNYPTGVAVDDSGNIYVADSNNNRIRLLTPSSPSCAYSLNRTRLDAPVSGGSFSVAIKTAAGCSWTLSGLPSWITVSGASSGSGPAEVSLAFAPDNSASARSAVVVIAGISVLVVQGEPPPPRPIRR